MIFFGTGPGTRPAEAGVAVAALRRKVELCGVFVNAPLEHVVSLSEDLGLSMLQFSGEEGPSFCAEAARRNGARVIKAAQVSGPGDVRNLERFHVDFHLLDARAKQREEASAAWRNVRDLRLDAGRPAPLEGPADPQRRADRGQRRRGDRADAPLCGRHGERHRFGRPASGPRRRFGLSFAPSRARRRATGGLETRR